MIRRPLLALASFAGFSIAPAHAQATPQNWVGALNVPLRQTTGPSAPSGACAPALQTAMYSLQAFDATATGAAVQHGAIGRTMFGSADAANYILSEAAFDAVIGMFTRHDGCKTKNALRFAIGASSMFNALNAGSRP